MTCVLVTRPREDAGPLADELTQMGFEVMLEPLMHIKIFKNTKIPLENIQGLLFTSANGLRAFAELSSTRTLPAYCVGDATAREAEKLGFSNIHTASGDVDKLADLVALRCNPNDGGLYHAAASALAGDLANRLENKGFKYIRGILYEAIHTEALTDQTIDAIMANKVGAVLLFSPRTARGFVNHIKKAKLVVNCKNLSLFCLSLNVENEIKELDWGMVATASAPNQKSLLALLMDKMG